VSLFTDVTYKYVALVRSKKIYEFLNLLKISQAMS